jgi:two-component system nitrate/nitrite response regulator NarL
MSEPAPRVLIADDDPDVRAVLVAQLSGRFDVVGTAAETDEAIALATDTRPDIAIVDVQMPGGGLRATREMCEATPETTIVALSADESERVVLDAGAVSYVRKGGGADELVALLDEAHRAHVKLPDNRR